MSVVVDISGRRFGKLVVIRRDGSIGTGTRTAAAWLCRCDCGLAVTVRGASLRCAGVKSCGICFRVKHGDAAKGRITREYRTWLDMRQRCQNPRNAAYADYGGRGIAVCDRWQNFENFLADMGPRPSPQHSLDRIDNNGHYESGNCRWATKKQQSRNRRDTVFVHDATGRRTSAMDVAENSGLSRAAIGWRLRAGISPETAALVPRYKAKRKAASAR